LSAESDLADNKDDSEEDSDEDVSALVYTEVWLVPGPYSGSGPSGYDSAGDPVGQEVYSRLTQHGQLDASNIEIVIDDGEVLLEGTVADEESKRLAEEAVETVSGVDRVQNLLRVQTGERDT
jgi:osmotically-inducible protein OsmY